MDALELPFENPKYRNFVAFTSTFYKDDVEWRVRSEAFFEMVNKARILWVNLVVGDGGSGPEFLQRVAQYPNVILFHSWKWGENSETTMGGERRFTAQKAMEKYPEAQYFLWLEPEKIDLMKWESIDAILDPLKKWSADIVVPSRKSKATLPPQQRKAENRANVRALDIINNSKMRSIKDFKNQWVWVWFDFNYAVSVYHDPYDWDKESYKDWEVDTIIGKTYEDAKWLDLWFGPKAFTKQSLEEDFLTYDGAKWDSIITPVLIARQQWKNIADVPVDFSYPPEQTQLETDPEEGIKYQKKRLSQYRYIIKTIKKLVAQI